MAIDSLSSQFVYVTDSKTPIATARVQTAYFRLLNPLRLFFENASLARELRGASELRRHVGDKGVIEEEVRAALRRGVVLEVLDALVDKLARDPSAPRHVVRMLAGRREQSYQRLRDLVAEMLERASSGGADGTAIDAVLRAHGGLAGLKAMQLPAFPAPPSGMPAPHLLDDDALLDGAAALEPPSAMAAKVGFDQLTGITYAYVANMHRALVVAKRVLGIAERQTADQASLHARLLPLQERVRGALSQCLTGREFARRLEAQRHDIEVKRAEAERYARVAASMRADGSPASLTAKVEARHAELASEADRIQSALDALVASPPPFAEGPEVASALAALRAPDAATQRHPALDAAEVPAVLLQQTCFLPHGLEAYTHLDRLSSLRHQSALAPDGTRVSLKRFRCDDEAQVRQFAREADVMLRLPQLHPNIVAHHGYLWDAPSNSFYTAWAWQPSTLLEWSMRPHSLTEIQPLILGLFHAVVFLHGLGAVHGKISPPTVLVSRADHFVLSNFDSCSLLPEAALSRPDLLALSLTMDNPDPPRAPRNHFSGYFAPEVLQGGSTTAKSDAYACGAILYRLAFPELEAPVPGSLLFPAGADPNLQLLLRALLEPNPEARCSLADALVHPFFTAPILEDPMQRLSHSAFLERLHVVASHRPSRTTHSIEVHRRGIVATTLHEFRHMDIRTQRPRVRYTRESGIDAGGLRREMYDDFFGALPTEAYFGVPLFTRLESGLLVPNPDATEPRHIEAFGTLAEILVSAWADNIPIAAIFADIVWKGIARVDADIRDFRECWPDAARTTDQLMAAAEEEVEYYGLSFDMAGGDERDVTADNRQEFVSALAQFKLQQVQQATAAMRTALLDAAPENIRPYLSFASPAALKTLLTPAPRLVSIDQLESRLNCSDMGATEGYIREMLREWARSDPDMLPRFIKFISGVSALPTSLSISPSGTSIDHLPEAHTCSLEINCPRYTSLEQTTRRFTTALTMCSGFAFG